MGQFENEQIRQVGDIVNLNRLERKHFADEKVKEEVYRRAQAEVLETLEALFRYAPSVDAMARLLQNIQHELGQATSELPVGMFQRRLRTLYFGQEDKAALVKNLLYTMPSVASEETAAAVLSMFASWPQVSAVCPSTRTSLCIERLL